MEDNEIRLIWDRFRYELLNFIKTKVNDEYKAEDILQEIFIKLYKNIDQLDDPDKLKPWLYKITNNTIIDYYRKRKDTAVQIEELEGVPEYQEESSNMNEEILTCLKSFLYELPDKYRDPLVMYEFKGMKHKDISEELNISMSGSKTRIQRAREKLKEALCQCCNIEFDAYGNIIDYKKKESYQCPDDKC